MVTQGVNRTRSQGAKKQRKIIYTHFVIKRLIKVFVAKVCSLIVWITNTRLNECLLNFSAFE